MGKLEDMRVERVDGVDRPATGHRWVIVKSEETVEKDYEGTARAALDALLKEEGVTFTKETADALHALAALLEMSVEFKSEDGEPGESDVEKTDEADEDTEVEKTDESDDDAPLTKATLRAALEELIREEEEAELTETETEVVKTEAKSKQSAEQDKVEKGERKAVAKGEGMFTNIIFGQD